MLLGWLAAVFLALPAGAAQYPSPLPPAAEQVLDQDWCSAASYDKA